MIDLSTVLPSDPRVVYRDDDLLLVCARWQDVIAELPQVDAVITDPPYSERTHAGSDAAVDRSNDAVYRQRLRYEAWTPDRVAEAADAWSSVCNGWIVAFTSHDLCPAFETAYAKSGRYGFAPLPVLQHRPRLSGDGPGNGCVWLMVSRLRVRTICGSLPCWYESRPEHAPGVMGAKPVALMQAIVRDYSREGDLILDPCAGGATTLVAAKQLGRQAIGIEMDPATAAKAAKRLAGVRRQLPLPVCGELRGEQERMDV